MAYRTITSIPPIGTEVRVTSGGKQYVGVVFCTPYEWRLGETHFSIKVPCGAVPVFVVERCKIEIDVSEEEESARAAVNNFVSALLDNMEDIDPKISKLVDEHFGELA